MLVTESCVVPGTNDLSWSDLIMPALTALLAGAIYGLALTGCSAIVPDIPDASGCIRACNESLGGCLGEGDACFQGLEACFDGASECSHDCADCERSGACADEAACDRACADEANACTEGIGECVQYTEQCIAPLVECTAACIEEVEDAL